MAGTTAPRLRDKLSIMAIKAVELRECDRCGSGQANTWQITGPDGVSREIELCDQHGAAIANAFALGRPVAARPARGRAAAASAVTPAATGQRKGRSGRTRSTDTPPPAPPEPL